jgi:hypothetical protein
MNTIESFADHPQLRLMEVNLEAGTVSRPSNPVVWRGEESPPRPRVPSLDEHGAALRAEFG